MGSNNEYEHQSAWVRRRKSYSIKPKSLLAVDVTADISSFKYDLKEKINIKPNKQ